MQSPFALRVLMRTRTRIDPFQPAVDTAFTPTAVVAASVSVSAADVTFLPVLPLFFVFSRFVFYWLRFSLFFYEATHAPQMFESVQF